jgi:Mitochondrial ribosomal death-associated protein 3
MMLFLLRRQVLKSYRQTASAKRVLSTSVIDDDIDNVFDDDIEEVVDINELALEEEEQDVWSLQNLGEGDYRLSSVSLPEPRDENERLIHAFAKCPGARVSHVSHVRHQLSDYAKMFREIWGENLSDDGVARVALLTLPRLALLKQVGEIDEQLAVIEDAERFEQVTCARFQQGDDDEEEEDKAVDFESLTAINPDDDDVDAEELLAKIDADDNDVEQRRREPADLTADEQRLVDAASQLIDYTTEQLETVLRSNEKLARLFATISHEETRPFMELDEFMDAVRELQEFARASGDETVSQFVDGQAEELAQICEAASSPDVASANAAVQGPWAQAVEMVMRDAMRPDTLASKSLLKAIEKVNTLPAGAPDKLFAAALSAQFHTERLDFGEWFGGLVPQGHPMRFDDAARKCLLPEGMSKELRTEIDVLSPDATAHIVLRRPMLAIVDRLRSQQRSGFTLDTLAKRPFTAAPPLLAGDGSDDDGVQQQQQRRRRRYVLEARADGAGVSTTVAVTVAWARANGWLVLYVPDAATLAGFRGPGAQIVPSRRVRGDYDLPDVAVQILEWQLAAHGGLLATLSIKGRVQIDGVERPRCGVDDADEVFADESVAFDSAADDASGTLRALLEFGAANRLHASDALYHYRMQLNRVTDCPVLVALDSYNSLLQPSAFVDPAEVRFETFDEQRRKLPPMPTTRITTAQIFERDGSNSPGLGNGVSLVGLTRTGAARSSLAAYQRRFNPRRIGYLGVDVLDRDEYLALLRHYVALSQRVPAIGNIDMNSRERFDGLAKAIASRLDGTPRKHVPADPTFGGIYLPPSPGDRIDYSNDNPLRREADGTTQRDRALQEMGDLLTDFRQAEAEHRERAQGILDGTVVPERQPDLRKFADADGRIKLADIAHPDDDDPFARLDNEIGGYTVSPERAVERICAADDDDGDDENAGESQPSPTSLHGRAANRNRHNSNGKRAKHDRKPMSVHNLETLVDYSFMMTGGSPRELRRYRDELML